MTISRWDVLSDDGILEKFVYFVQTGDLLVQTVFVTGVWAETIALDDLNGDEDRFDYYPGDDFAHLCFFVVRCHCDAKMRDEWEKAMDFMCVL